MNIFLSDTFFKEKFNEKVIKKDKCKIHYWISTSNNKPWLILLHGAGADHRMFNAQLPLLINNYNLLLWDSRGHGISKPIGDNYAFKLILDDIITILNKENIGKATIIGQSAGGNLAQDIAFYFPEKVESLVLVDCTYNLQKLSKMDRFLLNISPVFFKLYPWKSIMKQSAKVSSIKPEGQEYLIETFSNLGKKDFATVLSKLTDCLHYEDEKRLNKKILLVVGDKDNTGTLFE